MIYHTDLSLFRKKTNRFNRSINPFSATTKTTVNNNHIFTRVGRALFFSWGIGNWIVQLVAHLANGGRTCCKILLPPFHIHIYATRLYHVFWPLCNFCFKFLLLLPHSLTWTLLGKFFCFWKKTSASCGVVLGKVVNVYKKKVNAKNWQEEWGKT
jgi:hypothetical protein